VQIPIGSEENFRGVVDLIKMKAMVWYNSDATGPSTRLKTFPLISLLKLRSGDRNSLKLLQALMTPCLQGTLKTMIQ
jgi:translation elongation factor EF-G